ncbi:CYFA0S08e02718g1_1 [Cyberlindnera fabianii]|uniref:CYFA0S08e02718g1_1 n=1 Tax=Cyberlindnera fabianii TaxID=36022 RepID=A0A061B4V5_CYBFA|nr:CYFA0S08e02718g1_1 [Cyberlindnera fabianii]
MAKKISKHSRAARRNEIEEPEAKSLASLPRAEKTDTTSAIIRATAKKNEDLLYNKIAKKSDSKDKVSKKKSSAQITNLNKEKIERAMQLTDRLEGKIQKSKERARQVQTARKSNWDSINALARMEQTTTGATTTSNESKEEDVDEEDAMVDDFYNDEKDQQQESSGSKAANAFALLDEVEA